MQVRPNLEINCYPLASFDVNNWSSAEKALSAAAPCELMQAWRDVPEPAFQPAQVRVGWREEALWIYAEPSDRDIFNDATQLNDRTYQLGDLFEILVRPIGQDDYFEFHITPENNLLQLHWPDADTIWKFDDQHESLKPYLVPQVLLASQTQVQHQNNFWRVLAKIPASIALSKSIQIGDVWSFSFCRYDCTRGKNEPALSSCSPYAEPSFHRQQEWGRLQFMDS